MRLIAIAGKKGSGKSTLALGLGQMLAEQGHNWCLRSFSTPIKRAIADWFWVGTKDATALGMTGRVLYQKLGVACREIHPDWWVQVMKLDVAAISKETFVIIDDLRFKNELAWVESEGGFLVQLARDPLPPDAHCSEHDLDDVGPQPFHVEVGQGLSAVESLGFVWNRLQVWMEEEMP